jgi:hypothetical protein
VNNRAVADACLDALIVDSAAEGASYANHGEFLAEVAWLAQTWRAQSLLTAREAGDLTNAAARSHVGKTLAVRGDRVQ